MNEEAVERRLSDVLRDVRRRAEVFDWAGLVVQELVRAEFDPATTEVLDVGAGQGKYRLLLPEYVAMDACEVWSPTVVEHDLRSLYREVYNCEIQTLVLQPREYGIVILGDVLEHLTAYDARVVLAQLAETRADFVVVVPYLYAQGPEHGNHYQSHLQDDLTPEVMTRRYPWLRLIALETRGREPFKGVYRRNNS